MTLNFELLKNARRERYSTVSEDKVENLPVVYCWWLIKWCSSVEMLELNLKLNKFINILRNILGILGNNNQLKLALKVKYTFT